MVDFCPECESFAAPKKVEGGKKVLKCDFCGWEKPLEDSSASLTITERFDHSLDKTLVQDQDYYDQVFGAEKTKSCPRCKGKMMLKSQQTRSADEGITHFWICVKCKKSIRIYS